MMSPGGVCAVLDYDLDDMTEYVAEMTQRLMPTAIITSSSLRKFVSSLLSSTRLPSTTILLGMHYLAKRINLGNAVSNSTIPEKEVYRMLTVGLLLGSKFLDDNTFQNRSWSEVSSVPVEDLNKTEIDWLRAMNYNIYVNLDQNIDYKAWMSNWNQWFKVKSVQNNITKDLMTPLVTHHDDSRQRHAYRQSYSIRQKPMVALEPPPGFKHNYSKNIWGHSYATPPYLTPPSAPSSGLNTPIYMNMNASEIGSTTHYNEWTNQDLYSNQSYNRLYRSQVPTTYHHRLPITAYQTPVFHSCDRALPLGWEPEFFQFRALTIL